MTEDVRLLTYDEIASAFGITRESARQLVIRKRWARKKGNDGKARIEVPEDALEPVATSDSTPTDTSDDTGDDTSHSPSDNPSVVTVLTRHIERIESELSEAKAALAGMTSERDLERIRAAQVDALTAILEIERKRSDETRLERDRWAGMAEASQRQIADMTAKKPDAPMPEEIGFRGIVRRWLKVG